MGVARFLFCSLRVARPVQAHRGDRVGAVRGAPRGRAVCRYWCLHLAGMCACVPPWRTARALSRSWLPVVSWLLVVSCLGCCRGLLVAVSWPSVVAAFLAALLPVGGVWLVVSRLSVGASLLSRRGFSPSCRVVLACRSPPRARRSPLSSPRAGSFLAPSSARRRYIHLPLRQDPLVCFAGSIEVRTSLFWRGLAHALAPLSRGLSAGVLACSLARAASRLAFLGPTRFLRW